MFCYLRATLYVCGVYMCTCGGIELAPSHCCVCLQCDW